ncbi:hypothetical protein AB1Y20_009454 [Prymnesium parvum]|uniref:KIF-binding protein n=1 Tax=Prymnesium parvum TaxID=97485 RepID=A0AB34K467_PRYPA|mmetsp:Transcript_18217/g.38848  ORF Transcript_18217/g.38848 Transcript_18217/m.38848 type:complete len:215 (-) Transcript_18217:200-844(-)
MSASSVPADAAGLGDTERISTMLREFIEYFKSDAGKGEIIQAKSALPEEGQACYKASDYDTAAEKFTKQLAAVLVSSPIDHETEASLYANIGSCMHMLDELEISKKYYTKAIETFENHCSTSRLTWLLYGDINQRRIDYIKGRIGSLAMGKKPDKSKYLDGYGKEQQWSAYELGPEGQEFGYMDYVNPLSWYKYYTAVPSEDGTTEGNQAMTSA